MCHVCDRNKAKIVIKGDSMMALIMPTTEIQRDRDQIITELNVKLQPL